MTAPLSTAALDQLLARPDPARVAVFHRAGRGHRWRRVAVAPDHRAAVLRIDGPGEWWLRELPAGGPTLFDGRDPEEPE